MLESKSHHRYITRSVTKANNENNEKLSHIITASGLVQQKRKNLLFRNWHDTYLADTKEYQATHVFKKSRTISSNTKESLGEDVGELSNTKAFNK